MYCSAANAKDGRDNLPPAEVIQPEDWSGGRAKVKRFFRGRYILIIGTGADRAFICLLLPSLRASLPQVPAGVPWIRG